MDVPLLFFIAGSIIVVGFLGDLVYDKTKVPDVLMLLGVGILLGPVFKVVDHRHLTDFAEYFGTFALIVILFEGGMDIKIRMLLQEFGNATILVAISFISTTSAITAFLIYVHGWELLPSLMMATVLGCTSAAIVLPVLAKMSVKDETKTVLYIESAMSDVLAVVLAISLIEFVKLESIGIEKPLQSIASSFSIAIIAGTAFGLSWYKILNLMGERKYSYMVTLGVMLIVVAVVDFLGGSGPVAVLIFGVILGNCGDVTFIQASSSCKLIDETIKFFHGEVTFFIRTFFFVYMGMMVTAEALAPGNIAMSLVFVFIIVLMRYLSVEFMIRRSGKGKEEKNVFFYMLPRGLATAVLASLPLAAGIENSRDFIVYAVSVIVLTNIVMTAGVLHMERKRLKP
ncbi:MAG: cation:proton antiporter [Pseudomonadota bacterium]